MAFERKYNEATIRAAFKAGGTITEGAKRAGMSRSGFTDAVRRLGLVAVSVPAVREEKEAKPAMRTVKVSLLKKVVDPFDRVAQALAEIPAGELMPRDELVDRLKIGRERARLVLNAPDLSDRRIELRDIPPYPNGWYFGSKKDIEDLNQTLRAARRYK